MRSCGPLNPIEVLLKYPKNPLKARLNTYIHSLTILDCLNEVITASKHSPYLCELSVAKDKESLSISKTARIRENIYKIERSLCKKTIIVSNL